MHAERSPERNTERRTDLALASAALGLLATLEATRGLSTWSALDRVPGSILLVFAIGAFAAGAFARAIREPRQLALALGAGLLPVTTTLGGPVGVFLVSTLTHAGLVLSASALARGASRRSGDLRIAAVACIALAALLGPSVAPRPIWLLVTPAVTLLAVLCASWITLASSADAALSGVHPAVRPRLAGDPTDDRSPAGLRGVARDLLLPIGLLALFVPLAAVLLESLPEPRLPGGTPDERFDARSLPDEGSEEPSSEREAPFDGVFPDAATLGGPPRTIRHEEVLRVRSFPGFARGQPYPVGPLYLRGTALERFGRDGMVPARAPSPRRFHDEDDGARDGWTTLRAGWDARDLLLEIEQAPLYLQGSGWSLLFAPAGLRAVDLSPVEWEPDLVLAAPEPEAALLDPLDDRDANHRYRIRAVERRATQLDLEGARIDEPTRGLLQLPRGSTTAELRRRALEIAGDAATPEERVRAVAAHFADGFVYDLQTDHPPGLEGVLAFLDRRRGFCTAYASAATALLRALDVPARVATGFCASEWDSATSQYVVTTAQGHAWVEIPYAELGWVVFDPTPQEIRRRELASSRRAPGEGLIDWGREVLHDFQRWWTLGDPVSWQELAETFVLLPHAVASTLVQSWPYLVAVAALVAWVLRTRGRRSPADAEGPADAPPPPRTGPSDPLEERLVAALERRGHPRRPSDPLFGWSRRAATRDEDVLQAPRLALRLQRARFGAHPLDQEEQRRAEAVLATWEEDPSRS